MRKRMNNLACPDEQQKDDETTAIDRMKRFLIRVWSEHDEGYVYAAARDARSKRWVDYTINVDDLEYDLDDFLQEYSRQTHDLYLCPNAFEIPKRLKAHALPSCWGWADIDNGDVRMITPTPSVLWETSPGRTQALWRWDKLEKVTCAEAYSQLLSRRFGDPNGWSITKYLRIPFSINHKPSYDKPIVHLLTSDWRPKSERPPFFRSMDKVGAPPPFVSITLADMRAVRRDEVIKAFTKKVHPRVRALMRDKRDYEADRSKVIFEIVASLHEAKAALREIAAVLWGSAYFISKHGEDIKKLNSEIERIITKQGGHHE
jgi:RepB DNA-primase from phage plasmid